MISTCNNCNQEFDANKCGTVCSVCGYSFCPDCESKFFFNSSICFDCESEEFDDGYCRVPKQSERIW